MKKISLLCCALALVCALSGCKIIYQKMLEGTWKVDTYRLDGEDQTTVFLFTFSDYRIIFHPDGNCTETYKALTVLPVTQSGTWKISGSAQAPQLEVLTKDTLRIYALENISKDAVHLSRTTENGLEELFLEPVLPQ